MVLRLGEIKGDNAIPFDVSVRDRTATSRIDRH